MSEATNAPDAPPPQIGDLVIWTDHEGQEWQPARVREVYPDQGYCLVEREGSDLLVGLPIDQVRVVVIGPEPSSNGDGHHYGHPGGNSEAISAIPPRPPRPARPRIEAIPAELRERPQWVLWRYIFRDGKWTKLPFQPGNTVKAAKADVPSTWGTLDLALQVLDYPCDPAIAFDGIGYEFSADDPYFGIDVDNCLCNAAVLPWAAPILEQIEGTYGEISPSGNGIKFIARGKLPQPKGTRRPNMGPDGTGALELYDHGRFFALTGDAWGDAATITEKPDAAVNLYHMAKERPEKKGKGHNRNGKTIWDMTATGGSASDLDDDALLEKAPRAKNGAKFSALFDRGDTSEYGGDDSSADLALASLLAFWTGRDAVRIEALFSRSALGQRDKWRDRADYRRWTIEKAVESCAETFCPRPKKGRRIANPSANGDGHAATGGHAEGDVGLYFDQLRKLWVVGEEGPEPLCNFVARITHNTIRYEAGREFVRYRIRAQHEDPAIGAREIAVDSDKYASLSWVYALGAEFAPRAGRDTKDHIRCGIQLLSKEDGIASAVEYTSLGWINHKEEWLYLHAGGAIGADGPTDAVRVELPSELALYKLPDPPTHPEAIRAAVEATLSIWDLAKAGRPGAQGATAIIATLPWRAAIRPFNASPHLGGSSGTYKTSAARLALQHFAPGYQRRNPKTPAGWDDSKNGLQRRQYDCNCSLLLIDDLKTLDQLNVAEQVVQSQGNLQGRTRMGADQSLQPALDPRCALLSTGEIDCRTASSLGRMLVVGIKTGDIDMAVLTRLQSLGDAGLFATVMSAYVRWMAPRLDEVRTRFDKLTAGIRDEIGDIPGAHPRHPEAVAELIAAYRIYLGFAVEVGGIAPITADSYAAKAREYLTELATAQADQQTDSKPGRTFFDLIAAALRSKRCHLAVANSDSAPSQYPGACGWHKAWFYQGKDTGQMLDWCIPANSKLIGFIDEDAGLVYLDDTESIAVATEQGR